MIRLFDLDKALVAGCVYRTYPHLTTPWGVTLGSEMTEELSRFVCEYAAFLGLPSPYFRMDIYPREDGGLSVLEVNASFVDGWGTGLNLARAAGYNQALPSFPRRLAYEDASYLPELQLLADELKLLGSCHTLEEWKGSGDDPVYVYGRASDGSDLVFPNKGIQSDNKLNLVRFSEIWEGKRVSIPEHYTDKTTAWDDVPEDVFLKFVDKSGDECRTSRWSVQRYKPQGKSRFLKRCYREGMLLAQQSVPRYEFESEFGRRGVQLVILATADVLTGYVQFGSKEVINDDSIHGPLCFE